MVEGVLAELLQTPLAGPTELATRVNARLSCQDLTVANMEGALERMCCVPVLRVLRRQLEVGAVHYQEASLLGEMLESLSLPAPRLPAGACPPQIRGMRLANPLPWRCW